MGDEVKRVVIRVNNSVNGHLGFRLVGSRNSGVFVYSIQGDSIHANGLEIGDRLLQCDKIPLQGRTPEQVASILRFYLSRANHIFVIVKRETSIRDTLEKARREADKENKRCENMEEDPDYLEPLPNQPSTSNHEDLQEISNVQSVQISSPPSRIRRRMVKSFTTGDRVLLIACAADQELRSLAISDREDFEFDLQPGRFRCPICLKSTDLKRLHRLRHMWTLSTRRFLPFSFSDYAIL